MEMNYILGSNVKVHADIPVLKGPLQKLCINVSCGTAPTSGTITVLLKGVGA